MAITTLWERFIPKVSIQDQGCWLWRGSTCRQGYGMLRIKPSGKAYCYTHRLSWEFFRGEIPANLCVLHHCDVPACVNPNHLFLGTQADNNRDRAAKGRGRKSKFGLPSGVRLLPSGHFAAVACRLHTRTYIGTFETAEEASAAVEEWKRVHPLLPITPISPSLHAPAYDAVALCHQLYLDIQAATPKKPRPKKIPSEATRASWRKYYANNKEKEAARKQKWYQDRQRQIRGAA